MVNYFVYRTLGSNNIKNGIIITKLQSSLTANYIVATMHAYIQAG
jgi:hypothetical protein